MFQVIWAFLNEADKKLKKADKKLFLDNFLRYVIVLLATKMLWQKLYQLLRLKVTTVFNFLLIFTKLVNQFWKAQQI